MPDLSERLNVLTPPDNMNQVYEKLVEVKIHFKVSAIHNYQRRLSLVGGGTPINGKCSRAIGTKVVYLYTLKACLTFLKQKDSKPMMPVQAMPINK